ncbi:MAG: ABC transporter permease [Verrucomicrobia bacterium]|nr:ABC transporter permease [Verrucomicrobiota bacterium]
MFAVALGVGVVIAIDLAGDAAAGNFHSSLQALAGNSDLEISTPGGLDERLLAKLVQLPYAFAFSPRIHDFAFINGTGEAIPFIGLDLIGDGSLREMSDRARDLDIGNGDFIWAGEQLGLHAGERVRLLINDQFHPFTVAGVVKPQKNAAGRPNFILCDIGVAQKVTRKAGKLDSIDVKLPPGRGLQEWTQLLRRELPPSVAFDPEGARTDENRKMLGAFRLNLRAMSYVALLVGAFLIYNTISISVVRRRNDIGVARALGATKHMVLAAFLAEACFFATIGSFLGLLLGRLMAIVAERLVTGTVESLYVTSQPGVLHLSWGAILSGCGLGFAVSILAALGPAISASRVPPVEAMARGREEYIAAVRSHRVLPWAGLLFVGSALLCRMPPIGREPIAGYASVLLAVAGTAALVPAIVRMFATIAHGAFRNLLGVEAAVALTSLRAAIGRTSVLTAALAIAVAMTASVGIMVSSFRETLTVWLESQLQADLYLRPAAAPGADRYPTINAQIADEIQRIPGVEEVSRYRAYPIEYSGLPATLAGGSSKRIVRLPLQDVLRGETRDSIFRKLSSGDFAVVSEPFANKHDVHPGSVLRLPLGGAERAFTVLATYYDYSTEHGVIMISRTTLLKYLPDPAISSIGVFLKTAVDTGRVRHQIDRVIAGRAVLVFTNREVRRGALAIFDRTFQITYVLEAVAVFVAVMGIAGALLALVIDRRREFALLRFLGGAQPQIRRVILFEAGFIGLLANAVGVALGTGLSLILIFVINKQSFGWTLQFHWPVAVVLSALSIVYIATVLAALYPARIAMTLNPIEVIHEE